MPPEHREQTAEQGEHHEWSRPSDEVGAARETRHPWADKRRKDPPREELPVYFLAIIGASILLYRRGSLVTAGISALFYSIAVWAPYFPSLASFLDYEQVYHSLSRVYVLYRIVLTSFGFFLVAVLSSYLAETLRQTGEELSVTSDHLDKLERRSEDILQSIASGLVTMTLTGHIDYINRMAGKIVSIRGEEALGRHFLDIFELKEGWDPFENMHSFEREPHRVEGWVRGGLSEEQCLGMTFSLLRETGGQTAGVICSFQDLTQVKKMEEQIRRSDRLAVVGELAAGMAHEIRNPLASLSGSIQLLAEEEVPRETGRELMEIVKSEVSRLNTIITDFLRFANPRPLQLKFIDLLVILRDTVTLLQKSSSPECEILFHDGGEEECYAEVDPVQIKQVFWNFCSNAVEAMPAGGRLVVSIGRTAAGSEAREEQVKITFADTGVGIPAGEIDKVFTPFHSTKEQGTGLGLAIVSKIVEAHHGRIDVESRIGEGAVFSIFLPARQAVSTHVAFPTGEAT